MSEKSLYLKLHRLRDRARCVVVHAEDGHGRHALFSNASLPCIHDEASIRLQK